MIKVRGVGMREEYKEYEEYEEFKELKGGARIWESVGFGLIRASVVMTDQPLALNTMPGVRCAERGPYLFLDPGSSPWTPRTP
jgi:hypothetical protein